MLKDGRYIVDINHLVNEAKDNIKKGEKILINISDLRSDDLVTLAIKLKQELPSKLLKDIILIDYNDTSRSKRLG